MLFWDFGRVAAAAGVDLGPYQPFVVSGMAVLVLLLMLLSLVSGCRGVSAV